ncbi:MAG: hypothetical protein U0183_16830 [Polyangiaceae bacterium]
MASRSASAPRAEVAPPLFSPLEAKLAAGEGMGPSGTPEHRAKLEALAAAIREQRLAGHEVQLVFVCTHNSRRSQMAQLLMAAAARRAGLSGVTTFSAGTERTAFNPRAVAALRRAGLAIDTTDTGDNPRYAVRLGDAGPAIAAFSKRLDDPANPKAGFVAVMTCSQADAACPLVPGADRRIAIPYDDPKVADGTPEETARYDERVEQIGRDMMWVARSAAKSTH